MRFLHRFRKLSLCDCALQWGFTRDSIVIKTFCCCVQTQRVSSTLDQMYLCLKSHGRSRLSRPGVPSSKFQVTAYRHISRSRPNHGSLFWYSRWQLLCGFILGIYGRISIFSHIIINIIVNIFIKSTHFVKHGSEKRTKDCRMQSFMQCA